MVKEVKKWWNETSSSYQKSCIIHTNSAHYGPYAPDESELNLLGNVKGKRILEIGCGGGQCSIAFSKKGAKCTALDISEKQLEFARNLSQKNGVKVNFLLGDFQNLKKLKSRSFDIVFSAYALQYSPNLKKVFYEVNRLLKKNGVFVFSFDHPFYLTINPINMRIEKNYFETGRDELKITWDDRTTHKFVYFKTKVSDIYNNLVETGFYVERIIEPLKTKGQLLWTRGKWKKIYPKKAVKMIGPTIIFKTRKK